MAWQANVTIHNNTNYGLEIRGKNPKDKIFLKMSNKFRNFLYKS